jgi:hypothetical protein
MEGEENRETRENNETREKEVHFVCFVIFECSVALYPLPAWGIEMKGKTDARSCRHPRVQ